MDILYTNELTTQDKNEYLSELQFRAIMLVDRGVDETIDFGNKELHELIVKELKRRLLLNIEYKIKERSIKYSSATLRKFGIRARTMETILEEAHKKTLGTLRKLVNAL